MGNLSSGCMDCGKNCINVEFCSTENSTYEGVNLPRDLKVTILANEEYWGFSGVLTSGYATFNQGHYDYFEGFDEDWIGASACADGSTKIGNNEKRPDVTYRSVYDPDTGAITHYDAATPESENRGGAVAYLIDRTPGQVGAGGTEDLGTCPDIDPTESFKRFPENFGWGNKIHFDSSLYKNLTSAWRMVDYNACYDEVNINRYDSAQQLAGNGTYGPSEKYVTCESKPKQNFGNRENYLQYFDASKISVSGLNVLETGVQDTSCVIKGCLPDGSVAGEYAGEMAHSGEAGSVLGGFYREGGVTSNLALYLTYRNWSNSGELVPASGLRAGQTILVKNSVDDSYDGFYTLASVEHLSSNQISYDYTKAVLAGTYASGAVSIEVSGSQGSWTATNTFDPNTCCGLNAFGVDERFKRLDCDVVYHSDFRRVFNDSKFKLQSNRDPSNRQTYDYGTVTPYANVSGARDDKSYIGTTSLGNPSGELNGGGYTPYFPKQLPYYGVFYETDTCDNVIRGDVKLNTGKTSNATCFTKQSTLEVFPDCYTQYHKYKDCDDGIDKYKINRLPRMAFVYRGCDYHDSCSFDASGRPYEEPTGIEDLRRGRGGEEIHMFVNLGPAWASTILECTCDITPPVPGTRPNLIKEVVVDSPVTFPSFPDFDLKPEEYGCDDETFQLAQYLRYVLGSDDITGSPNAGLLPSGFCSEVPALSASCNVRQPYTTYGYIMNLCGAEQMDRRGVIEAFNSLHQSGTCNHLNTSGCSGVVEPFYRGFTVPSPAPYSSGDYWQVSGIVGEQYIYEKTGEQVGYWGLTDVNGALISPYYKTELGVAGCETITASGYIDFSQSGNYIDGWPTEDVPFLVQIEADTRCVGCTSSMMETGNLTLNIESLTTKFLFEVSHFSGSQPDLGGDMFGYNHCNYAGIALDATSTFLCSSGFKRNFCDPGTFSGYSGPETTTYYSENGDGYYETYGVPHTGQTCPSLDGLAVTLTSRMLGSSNYAKGWQTGSGEDPYVKLFTNTDSNFLNEEPGSARLANGGYSLYAKFGLGCPSMNTGKENSQMDLTLPIRMNSAYIDISSNDAVRVSFGGEGCPGHYPPKLTDNQFTSDGYRDNADLKLYGGFWAVAPEYEGLFEAINKHQLDLYKSAILDGGRIQTLTDGRGVSPYNVFGLCSGDKIYSHGCFLESGAEGVTMGSNSSLIVIDGVTGMFYGVSGAGCSGPTLCNTCPKTDWPAGSYPDGNVICDPLCATGGTNFGYLGMGTSGSIPEWNILPPRNYEFNNCYCLCKDPTVFGHYEVTGSEGEVGPIQLMYGIPTGTTNYWYSMSRSSTNETGVSGLGPFMITTGPPNHPNIAFELEGVSPQDWFTYSHGANGLSTGIQHDLVKPAMLLSDDGIVGDEGCDTLSIKTCATGYDQNGMKHSGCLVDPTNRADSANCKTPIYNADWNDSYTKTTVPVKREACFPETMIVNKIECKDYFGYPYYDLVVSREYLSHDRTWRKIAALEGGNGCGKHIVGAYFFPDASGCTGCTPIPYSVPSDLVTPVYETPCSIHPSTGAYVSQDFIYATPTGIGVAPSGGDGGGGGPPEPPE
jgi:hypothetical protein